MKKRTRKLLSLLLAASMVFGMNTMAFADDIVAENADTATVESIDAAEDEAGVSNIINNNDKGEPTTTIKYELDSTNKKATVPDICTITNTDDPVSWNNAYGRYMISTVLFGSDAEDEWLNNSKPVKVSENSNGTIPEYRQSLPDGYQKVEVIPIESGSSYIFMAYGLGSPGADDMGSLEYVAGHDDPVPYRAGLETLNEIPVITWDGRKINYNKSGSHKYDKGKKEALNVKLAFVTYSGGTVTEIPGVVLGSVKVDMKTQKGASVALEATSTSKTYKITFDEKSNPKSDTKNNIIELPTLGDLPFFTITAKVNGKNASSYKKAIAAKLKEDTNKWYFGIRQKSIGVALTGTSGKIVTDAEKASISVNEPSDKEYTYVASNNGYQEAEKSIAESLTNSAWFDADVDNITSESFKMTKFNGKKANIQLRGAIGDDNKGYWIKELGNLKFKKDFDFSGGSLAGQTVQVLELTGTNLIYSPLNYVKDDDGTSKYTYKSGDKDVATKYWTGNLAQVGFRFAFRMSPTPKSKKFRFGIYRDNNWGFVFNQK